ncbi:MAG: hypothetical protein GY711_26235 [bacterium]|nr:hypothetical protein [bacterium]
MQIVKTVAGSLVAVGLAHAQTQPATYYVNFPSVPANQQPNTMYTEATIESLGVGWLQGSGFAGENQFWVNVQATTGPGGGGARVVPYEYRVSFRIVPEETRARNLDQMGPFPWQQPDFDLYSIANDPTAFPMLFDPVGAPPYRYDFVVPADAPANGQARRINLRTFQDPFPWPEGFESVTLELTGVEFTFSPPPEDVQLVLGDNTKMRWLIRDAWFHFPSTIQPPTSDIVVQFSHSSPWMSGLDYLIATNNPNPGSVTIDHTQPSVKFITEGLNDFGEGPASSDRTGIRFFTQDVISTCTAVLPLGCGNVVGVPKASQCEFDLDFQIDFRSTAKWGEDFRMFDFFTGDELVPDAHGNFSTRVPIRPGRTETLVGHVIRIDAYRNAATHFFSELPYEEVIIHMTGARRADGCTTSPEPEIGWSSVAVWIIEDNPDH